MVRRPLDRTSYDYPDFSGVVQQLGYIPGTGSGGGGGGNALVFWETSGIESDIPITGLSTGGGALTVTTVHIDTAPGSGSTVAIGTSFLVTKITTDAPGRFRLYESATAWTADVSRPVTTPASAGVGLICEVNFMTITSQALSPFGSGDIAVTENCVWDWSGATANINVTAIVLET